MKRREFGVAIIAAPGDQAERIARAIVDLRLAACAQVTAEVVSIYWWKGRRAEAREKLVILKTEKSFIGLIRDRLKNLHPYDVPELIFLPVTAGNPDYMAWLTDVMFKKI